MIFSRVRLAPPQLEVHTVHALSGHCSATIPEAHWHWEAPGVVGHELSLVTLNLAVAINPTSSRRFAREKGSRACTGPQARAATSNNHFPVQLMQARKSPTIMMKHYLSPSKPSGIAELPKYTCQPLPSARAVTGDCITAVPSLEGLNIMHVRFTERDPLPAGTLQH